jgi:hypothetical protein
MSAVSPTHLLTRPATLIERVADPETPDEYGNPGWTETGIDTACELQQVGSSEALGDAVQVTLWRLFLPAETPARGWDALRLEGDDVLYELEGDPWQVRNPRTGAVSHVEASARRVE